MPSLQDIRQFNQRLVFLGNEPEVVAGWGEQLEEVDEPDTALDSDISSLLSDTGDLNEEDAAGTEPPDFSALLADEGEEGAGEEPAPPGDDALPEGAPEEPADLFGPGVEDGGDDDFTGAELGDLGDLGGDEEGEEEPSSPDEFAEPFELDDELFAADEETIAGPDEAAGPEPTEEAFDFSEEDFADELEESDGFDIAEGPEAAEVSEDFEIAEGIEISEDEGEPEESEEPEADEIADQDVASEEEVFGLGEEEFTLPEEFTFSDEEPDEVSEGTAAEEFDIGAGPEEIDVLEGGDELGELSLPDEEAESFEFTDEEFGDDISIPEGDFSFEAPSVPGAEPEEPGEDEFGLGDEDELGEIDEDIDEFSLGDFGAEFGVIDEEGPSEEDLNPAINVPEVAPGVPAATPTGFQISDGDFQRLRHTLASLPLNLKAEVQKIIAQAKGSSDQVEKLVDALVAGESAQAIATLAGRILGTQIRIPRSYEKRTGADFERERQSFGYQFRENILPIVRVVVIFVAAVTVLVLAGYHLAFRPLYARSLYRDGLEQIGEDQYTLGNETFERAWEVWSAPRWYYDYADAFIQKRQYGLAAEKYRELLFTRDPGVQADAARLLAQERYGTIVSVFEPPDQGILDYADLESEILGNYQQADRLLQIILTRDTANYDARLAVGDNYMRWAEEEPARYEDARLAYARLLERFGHTDELLFRMLRYFIRTDNLDEVVRLKEAFQADPRAQIDPGIYAELAGYLIDRQMSADVEDILFRALDVDTGIPEIHYELARYYRTINASAEEDLALRTAVSLLRGTEPFTRGRRAKLIDALTRQGENLYDSEDFLEAQERFTEAIALYEEGRRRRILDIDPIFGRAYARLADIFYYIGRQYQDALVFYDSAEENGYDEPNMDYKQGFIYYRQNQVDLALIEFRQAAEDPSGVTDALLWATANTNYRRGNYFAAEAYYLEVLERSERKRDRIRTLLLDEDPSHRSVVEYMIRGYNNLGVTLNRLYDQTSDPQKYSEGLYYLTLSTEMAENYGRDPDTLRRSDAVDLAFLNTREILYPRPEYELLIYNDIPEDLDDLEF